jgi:hypothetical protein
MESGGYFKLNVKGQVNVRVSSTAIHADDATCIFEDNILTIESKIPNCSVVNVSGGSVVCTGGISVSTRNGEVDIHGNCKKIRLNGRDIPIESVSSPGSASPPPVVRYEIPSGMVLGKVVAGSASKIRFDSNAFTGETDMDIRISGATSAELGNNAFKEMRSAVSGASTLKHVKARHAELFVSGASGISDIYVKTRVDVSASGASSIQGTVSTDAVVVKEGETGSSNISFVRN